jgi:tetratricopeptide (TPR) repeat protein
MKSKRRDYPRAATAAVASRPAAGIQSWQYAVAVACAVMAVFWAYGPALHGPFLFDDNILPFALPGFSQPLSVWLRNVRPALMLTYWMNSRLSGDNTFSYHVVNIILHCITSGLVFLIVRRLLEWNTAQAVFPVPESRRNLLAAFAAAVFLLHPAQAEAVAYLAGRSEELSVLLLFAAFTVFIYRHESAISWPVSAAVLLLFGAALLAKEHTIVLPALLLLTDYWWNPGFSFKGIRANWKVYVPLALGAAGGVAFFWRLITTAESAGFRMQDFTWYQYFFTQCRALFVYLGMFVLPINLTADWDFPISHTIFERGAIIGLVVLVALVAVAWQYRRRYPLATYGFLAFLLLMAPTSSILPIRDPIAERRIYLSMIGLILVVVDLLSRTKLDRKALSLVCGIVVLFAGFGAHARAAAWSSAVALWEDTVQKSPNKLRARFQLGFAYYEEGRFDKAVAEFEKAAQIEKPSYNILIDWALAYDGLNRPSDALARLEQAAAIERTAHVYTQIGMIYAKQGLWNQAMSALATAESIDPTFAMTYVYKGKIHMRNNEPAAAIPEYRHALAIDPTLADARQDLALAQRLLQAGH